MGAHVAVEFVMGAEVEEIPILLGQDRKEAVGVVAAVGAAVSVGDLELIAVGIKIWVLQGAAVQFDLEHPLLVGLLHCARLAVDQQADSGGMGLEGSDGGDPFIRAAEMDTKDLKGVVMCSLYEFDDLFIHDSMGRRFKLSCFIRPGLEQKTLFCRRLYRLRIADEGWKI